LVLCTSLYVVLTLLTEEVQVHLLPFTWELLPHLPLVSPPLKIMSNKSSKSNSSKSKRPKSPKTKAKKLSKDVVPTRRSQVVLDKSVDYLESRKEVEMELARELRSTNVGIKIMFAGLSRTYAERVAKLSRVVESIEDKLFDPALIETLRNDPEELKSLLDYAQNALNHKVNFMQYVTKSIDYTEVEAMLEGILRRMNEKIVEHGDDPSTAHLTTLLESYMMKKDVPVIADNPTNEV